MATEAQVFITGIKNVLSFRGTLNHGIQPSTFVVDIVPQQVNEPLVEIAVKYPHPVKAFELKECLIDSSSYSAGRSGLISTLYIRDFRWKWAYKHITLLANIRRGDGEIIIHPQYKYHEKKMSVDDILDELEKALGARIIRSAKLPENYYPEIIWDNYNAAAALNDLLSPLAVRIVPSYDPDVVSIHNAGVGGTLPQDDIESYGTDLNPREKPKRIRVVSAPVLKTVDIGLYPVIKSADSGGSSYADWSMYEPTLGRWGEAVDVSNEVATYPNKTGRDLTTQECQFVEESAFSWFIVSHSSDPPTENSDGNIEQRVRDIQGYKAKLQAEYDILRGMQNFICEQITQTQNDASDGLNSFLTISPRRPFVYGAFYHEQETDLDASASLTPWRNSADSFDDIPQAVKNDISYVEADTNEGNETRNDYLRKFIVPAPFSIDFDTGIVKFSRKVYLSKNNGELYFPELCLRVAVKTINEQGTFNRLEWVINVDPKSPADEIYIERNDIVPMIEYNQNLHTEAKYLEQLRNYAEQVLKSLNTPDLAGTATYAGIKAIPLDGIIQTVSWSISQSGARTTATYNHDTGDATTLSFQSRQQAIEVAKAIRDAEVSRNADRREFMGLPEL